jgi:hypothetical protein
MNRTRDVFPDIYICLSRGSEKQFLHLPTPLPRIPVFPHPRQRPATSLILTISCRRLSPPQPRHTPVAPPSHPRRTPHSHCSHLLTGSPSRKRLRRNRCDSASFTTQYSCLILGLRSMRFFFLPDDTIILLQIRHWFLWVSFGSASGARGISRI